MFFNEISYPLQVHGDAQLGPVRLSYGCKVFEKENNLFVPDDREFLGLYFNLGNDFQFTFNDYFTGTLHRGHYVFLYQPHASCEYGVKKGKVSEFGIHFTVEFLRAMAIQSPILDAFFKSVEARQPFALTATPVQMTQTISAEIKRILYSRNRWDEERRVYLFSRVLDILALCLEQISVINGPDDHLPYQLVKIDKVHDYLINHLQHQCSLSLLAHEVGMEPRSMTRTFKRVYGKTVIEFLFDERMKKAIALMREGEMNVKEIAHTVGYAEHANFTRAFKRKFGHPPTRFRPSDFTGD
jgi:AraC-like DNA-binding protein